ncbi:MAG TPA: DUF4303 domain-containing protein [Tepidisphaeraceae bacterium]|nr:DUF4303 domain-containing protein [Tepidisphaeraceae bacterium]
MPQPPAAPSHDELRHAFVADLAASWVYHRHLRADHTPYAFALYGVESPTMFTAHVLTEEGLTGAARAYLNKEHWHYGTVDEAREALRWSVADAPPASRSRAEQDLPTVRALFQPHEETLGEIEGYKVLAEAAIDAFRQLDAEGFFGAGTDRQRLTLVIITEGTDADWTIPSVRVLNPPAVVERFEAAFKVEGVYARCHALAVSPGGGSLYAGTQREEPAREGGGEAELVAHVVACDLRGGRLSRRWDHPLGPRVTVNAIACSPDGRSVYAAWTYSRKGKSRGGVTRFARGGGPPIAQQDVPFGATDLAVSADGRFVAITGGKKSILLFDADLRPARERQFDPAPYALRFLRDGRLLALTRKELLVIDPTADDKPAAHPFPGFRLSTDDAGQLLAVSPLPRVGGLSDQPAARSVQLLRLPALEAVRSVGLSGHDADKVALSPDGRLLAFEAEVIGHYRGPVVVFDTATGREVARRKVESVESLAFLRDGRTLAVGTACHTTGEAVELWAVPGV